MTTLTLEQVVQLGTFATVWAVLAVGHTLADHVLGQTDAQAAKKAAPTAEQVASGAHPHAGWGACLAHVGQYHLVLAAVFSVVWLTLPLPVSWWGLLAGFAFSAGTHAILDRRWPVRAILRRCGSPRFADLRDHGLNGMYLADQALHSTALMISALLITRL